jgi:hypothetical protein
MWIVGIRGVVRDLVRRAVPQSVRDDLRLKRAEVRGIGQLKVNQALLAQRLAELEAREGPAPAPPVQVPDDRFPANVRSRLCTQAQLSEPWFEKWCAAAGEAPTVHRKSWEFAYIAEVLDSLGMLEPGRRGLGFGVGREPLISVFASLGVEVVATDLDPHAREAGGWLRSDQHADGGLEGMLRPGVCDPETFKKLVSWRAVDMRAIPADLQGFDFCWSTCALEHLGTLDYGLEFIERSLATLAPGGIAVHTTEFNLSSNDKTIESGPTVVYRERDILALVAHLEAAGHEVAALDLSRGEGLLDRYVDVPPYSEEPVLRFWYNSYTLTSVAIIVRAAGRPG